MGFRNVRIGTRGEFYRFLKSRKDAPISITNPRPKPMPSVYIQELLAEVSPSLFVDTVGEVCESDFNAATCGPPVS